MLHLHIEEEGIDDWQSTLPVVWLDDDGNKERGVRSTNFLRAYVTMWLHRIFDRYGPRTKCVVFVSMFLLFVAIPVVSQLAGSDGVTTTTTRRRTRPQLRFAQRENITQFTIMQVADIHLGENSWDDWGPQQDVNTYRALQQYVTFETSDLVVLSGDQITGDNIDANATTYYQQLGDFFDALNISFATIFGNHDDAPLVDRHNASLTYGTKTGRVQLLRALRNFRSSYTPTNGPASLPAGMSNYYLDLWHERTVAARLIMLDTGGGTVPQQITTAQLDWINTVIANVSVPVLVFAHIPTIEFAYNRSLCAGTPGEGIAPLTGPDAGLVATLQQHSHVQLLAVGHNHNNDYCCALDHALHVCYGQHSGYGGYSDGTDRRGVRVYQLTLDMNNTVFSWQSWVRTMNGTVEDRYSNIQ